MRPVPGLTLEQQPQDVLLRCCIWGEARGESSLGKLAVLWVIRNRAIKSGASIADVILKHSDKGTYQFTSFDPKDVNASQLLYAWKDDPLPWARIDALCELAESWSGLGDPTYGSTHYYVADMPNPPVWGRGHKDWKERAHIGRHVFGECP
jgi:spore germination cell wall hydrolase CwlJ-like protein